MSETIEKYGGLWHEDSFDNIVFEKYFEDMDLLGLVRKRDEHLFVAVLLRKVADYQFALPSWSEIKPEALFDNEQDASNHVVLLLNNNRRTQ